MYKVIIALLLCTVCAWNAWASIDVYEFSSDEERKRYQVFLEELRCPKCKNNNLSGTNSKIAVDLRRQLHEMIEQGKSDQEIVDFMVLRYGDFVLYRPRVQSKTMALWAGPLVFLGLGLCVIGVIVWRRRTRLVKEGLSLSTEQEQALDRLLQSNNADEPNDSNKQS